MTCNPTEQDLRRSYERHLEYGVIAMDKCSMWHSPSMLARMCGEWGLCPDRALLGAASKRWRL